MPKTIAPAASLPRADEHPEVLAVDARITEVKLQLSAVDAEVERLCFDHSKCQAANHARSRALALAEGRPVPVAAGPLDLREHQGRMQDLRAALDILKAMRLETIHRVSRGIMAAARPVIEANIRRQHAAAAELLEALVEEERLAGQLRDGETSRGGFQRCTAARLERLRDSFGRFLAEARDSYGLDLAGD